MFLENLWILFILTCECFLSNLYVNGIHDWIWSVTSKLLNVIEIIESILNSFSLLILDKSMISVKESSTLVFSDALS